jgi:hypothetical protein
MDVSLHASGGISGLAARLPGVVWYAKLSCDSRLRAQHLAAFQNLPLWIRIANDRHAGPNGLTLFPDNSEFLRHAN